MEGRTRGHSSYPLGRGKWDKSSHWLGRGRRGHSGSWARSQGPPCGVLGEDRECDGWGRRRCWDASQPAGLGAFGLMLLVWPSCLGPIPLYGRPVKGLHVTTLGHIRCQVCSPPWFRFGLSSEMISSCCDRPNLHWGLVPRKFDFSHIVFYVLSGLWTTDVTYKHISAVGSVWGLMGFGRKWLSSGGYCLVFLLRSDSP